MTTDTFLGAWLVSEYVFNPDGRFAGIVRQRRELTQLANGNIRVTQHCQPEETLTGHPMAAFTGEPLFDLQVDGRFRRYLGPAVIGSGLAWGEGAMTGSGLWPDFGHNFRSFALIPVAGCQLTGGKFFNATEMVANIAGVAVLEAPGTVYPALNQTYQPDHSVWQGTIRTVLADGTIQGERPVQRWFGTVTTTQIRWVEAEQTVTLTWENGRYRTANGLAKRYGPLLEMEQVFPDGVVVEWLELLDTVRGHLVGIRRWLKNDLLQKIEVVRMKEQA